MSGYIDASAPGGDWGSTDNNTWSEEVNHAAAHLNLGDGEATEAEGPLSWPKVVDIIVIDPDYVASARAQGSERKFIAVDGVYVELTDDLILNKVCPADLNNQHCEWDDIPVEAISGGSGNDRGCRLIRICKASRRPTYTLRVYIIDWVIQVASKFWAKDSFTCTRGSEMPCPCAHDIEVSCPMVATTCRQEGMHDHRNFEARVASFHKVKAHNDAAKKYMPDPAASAVSRLSHNDNRTRHTDIDNPNACFKCGETGHRKADCPNPPKDKRECHKCGQAGHISKDCLTGSSAGRACFVCGKTDHQKANCQYKDDPAYMTCNNCQDKGHPTRQCTKKKDYSRIKCNNCQQMGHTKTVCKNLTAGENALAPTSSLEWEVETHAVADTTNINDDNNAEWANGGAAKGASW